MKEVGVEDRENLTFWEGNIFPVLNNLNLTSILTPYSNSNPQLSPPQNSDYCGGNISDKWESWTWFIYKAAFLQLGWEKGGFTWIWIVFSNINFKYKEFVKQSHKDARVNVLADFAYWLFKNGLSALNHIYLHYYRLNQKLSNEETPHFNSLTHHWLQCYAFPVFNMLLFFIFVFFCKWFFTTWSKF